MILYTWLKNEQPRSFFKDEHSLLISYDIIPLRGLDQARAELNKAGEIATGRLVKDPLGTISVAFRYGNPDIDAIDWGCRKFDGRCGSYSRDGACLRALCAYVSYIWDFPQKNKFDISNDENLTLRAFAWRYLSDDGRRRRPLVRLEPRVVEILARYGFTVESVKFEKVK